MTIKHAATEPNILPTMTPVGSASGLAEAEVLGVELLLLLLLDDVVVGKTSTVVGLLMLMLLMLLLLLLLLMMMLVLLLLGTLSAQLEAGATAGAVAVGGWAKESRTL